MGRGRDGIEIYNLIKCCTAQQTLGGLMMKSTRFLRHIMSGRLTAIKWVRSADFSPQKAAD